MSTPERLVITPIPSLVSILLHAETKKGSPLTREEVLAIRDGAVSVALPESAWAKVVEGRGYDDLNPDFAWEQWQVARIQLRPPDAKA